MPEQQVTARDGGGFTLEFRPPVAAEEWNAQVSLLTGMAAATMMLEAGVGVLRTMPAPTPEAVAVVPARRARPGRRVAGGGALRRVRPWPRPLRTRATSPSSTRRRRSSAARATPPSTGRPPAQPEHAAVAAPYAHVTAPLRRLVDRFGLVVCEAACRGADVPDAVRAALPAARRADARLRPAGAGSRAGLRRRDRGGGAARPRGRVVRRHRGRPHRQGHGGAARRPAGHRPGHGSSRRARRRTCRCGSTSPTCGPARWPSATSDADPYTGGGRVGRTVASVGNHRRGRSGLRRAGWWPTATRGDPRDSATENRPPRSRKRAG